MMHHIVSFQLARIAKILRTLLALKSCFHAMRPHFVVLQCLLVSVDLVALITVEFYFQVNLEEVLHEIGLGFGAFAAVITDVAEV